METLVCSNCGANTFEKHKSQYICKYCGSSKVVVKQKYIKILLFSLALVLLLALFNYSRVLLVEEKIQDIKLPTIQLETITKSKNPFKFLTQRVEKTIDKPLESMSLISALEHYFTLENPKAFSMSYDDNGYYFFGFSNGFSQDIVEENALFNCNRYAKSSMKNEKYEKCVLYLENDLFVKEEDNH